MRYISLLEFQPGLRAPIIPPSSYLEGTNGTLSAEYTRLVIDDQGFMVTERPLSAHDTKVLLLGGSSLENLYVAEGSRILAVLEAQLNAEGVPAKVYSAGISNAHLLHLLNLLLNKGIALRPQVVVWYPTSGADAVANERQNTFWNPSDAMSTIRKHGRDLRIDLNADFVNRDDYQDERRLLHTMFDLCGHFGIQLAASTWPVYGMYDAYMARIEPDREAFETCDAAMRRLNEVIREVCQERAGVLVDLEATFATQHRPDHFYDRNHPNALGCQTIATATLAALRPHLSPASR
jgi:hypothetical protein